MIGRWQPWPGGAAVRDNHSARFLNPLRNFDRAVGRHTLLLLSCHEAQDREPHPGLSPAGGQSNLGMRRSRNRLWLVRAVPEKVLRGTATGRGTVGEDQRRAVRSAKGRLHPFGSGHSAQHRRSAAARSGRQRNRMIRWIQRAAVARFQSSSIFWSRAAL